MYNLFSQTDIKRIRQGRLLIIGVDLKRGYVRSGDVGFMHHQLL